MYKAIVFAGTTEGYEISRFLPRRTGGTASGSAA